MDGAGGVFKSHSPTAPHFEVIKPRRKDLSDDQTKSPRKLSRRPRRIRSQDIRTDRTVFVGNIPVNCTKKSIKQLFKQYGSIESIRFRSMKVSPGDRPSRLAKRTQKQLVEGSSFNAYVVMSSTDEAESCLGLNGVMLQGRHLRIDMIAKKSEADSNKTRRSVFVGNLPFSADEEKLREIFSVCGEIENIRIVRDSKSGVGKGFGFITFKDRSSVLFALKQNKKSVLDTRTLRVHRAKDQVALQREKQCKTSGFKCVSVKSKFADSGSVTANKIMGKRRPDGTKNRYYRLPVS